MTCHKLQLPGGGIAIACTRGRRASYTLCDGCDVKLDPREGVSPKRELDFCPNCARPAFDWWKANAGGAAVYGGREPLELKRNAFRFWARQNAEKFLELVKRTAASVAEVGA